MSRLNTQIRRVVFCGLLAGVLPVALQAQEKAGGWGFGQTQTDSLSDIVKDVKDATQATAPAGDLSDFGTPTYEGGGAGDGTGGNGELDLDKIFDASIDVFDIAMEEAQQQAGVSMPGVGMPIPLPSSTGSDSGMGAGVPLPGGRMGGAGADSGMPMPGQESNSQQRGGSSSSGKGYPTDGGLAENQPPMPGRRPGESDQQNDNEPTGEGDAQASTNSNNSTDGDSPEGSASDRRRTTSDPEQVAEAEMPEDLPPVPQPGSANAVLAGQIREAALAEADPQVRDSLWEEYRKLASQ